MHRLAFLGPTPERNKRLPTFLACGYSPTGLGAFSEFICDESIKSLIINFEISHNLYIHW